MWKWSIFPKIIIDILTQPGFELCGVADLSLSDQLLMWSGGLVWRIRAHPPFLGSRSSNWRSDLISFRSKTSISKTCLYLVSCNKICLFWWKKEKKENHVAAYQEFKRKRHDFLASCNRTPPTVTMSILLHVWLPIKSRKINENMISKYFPNNNLALVCLTYPNHILLHACF